MSWIPPSGQDSVLAGGWCHCRCCESPAQPATLLPYGWIWGFVVCFPDLWWWLKSPEVPQMMLDDYIQGSESHTVSSSWSLYLLPKLKVWEGIWHDSSFPPLQNRQQLLKTLLLLSDSRQGCDFSSITWVCAKPGHEVLQWPQQGTAG